MVKDTLKEVFQDTLQVRWGDMDAFGHVNNCRYLTYFEQVRINWLRSINAIEPEAVCGPIMITADCTYLKAIVFPAELSIKLFAGDVGRTSFMTYHEIYVDDVLHACGSVKLVWLDYSKHKPVEVPEKIKTLLRHPSS